MNVQKLPRIQIRLLLALLALIAATATLGGMSGSAQADPLVPAPTTGTATGSYRTGLTRAGLVQVTSLTAAHVYLGVAAGATAPSPKTDVRVELLNNGSPVASGMVRCISALTSTPTDVVVPWNPLTAPTLHAGDVLSLRVSSRLGTKPDDSKCASNGQFPGIRAYYDAGSAPTRFLGPLSRRAQQCRCLHTPTAALARLRRARV